MKTPQNGFTFTASVERLLVFLALISVGAYVLEVEFAGSRNSLEGDRFWLWTECMNPFFPMYSAKPGFPRPFLQKKIPSSGFGVVDGKVYVHDLHATLLHLLGFDHEQLPYRFQGQDFRLTDVHGKIVQEILA